MLPTVHVLGVSIKTFGVFFALNFVAWGFVAARRLRELGKPPDWAYELVLAAVVGGLIGARVYYIAQNGAHGGLTALFGGTGLIWYGGLIGGIVSVVVWARWRGAKLIMLCDIAGPCLALGYAIGRIGCQVSGDGDYGNPSHLPWAMSYRHGTVPTPPGVRVQPTPIYETLVMGLVAFVLWRLRDRVRPGILFAGYLVLAGVERFLIEFIRRNPHVLATGLTAAQLESIASFVIGAIWLAIAARRGGLLRPHARQVSVPGPARRSVIA